MAELLAALGVEEYEYSVGWKLPTLVALLWVVALGAWAGVVVGLISGPWGAVGGTVLTVLAGVVTAYVPSFRDQYRLREGERQRAREELRRIGELPVPGGPSGLLDPRRGLVGFVGREQELAGLIDWCESGQPTGVRLVTGEGGVGKTRLSVELCGRLERRGWRWVRVGDRTEGSALQAARRGWAGPVLLVIDYAETRPRLSALLRVVAADRGVVRVLLLARSAGEWWDRLAVGEPAVRDLLARTSGGDPLPVAVSGDLSNEEIVTAAIPAFADALKVPRPGPVRVTAGRGPVRVLDLHAAALVAVLRESSSGKPVLVRVADVLDELLGHEERFWQGSAARLGLLDGPAGLTPRMLRHIVAAGALLGASSQQEAVQLLGRVPGVTGSLKVASWLRQLYPPAVGQNSEWLGTLAPGRLAERLVILELGGSPELARRCLTGLDERQALRAVTVLGRAAADEEAAVRLLERLLPLVEQVVADLPTDLELLSAISAAIPYPSTALAAADLALTRRILELVPPGQSELRVRWLSLLGLSLAQSGELTDALTVTEEAVTRYRELAAAYPDRYRADLASSLTNLGNRLAELGRPADALPPTEEAITNLRELAGDYPDRYRTDLAVSLSNLGNRLAELGRPGDALAPAEEAVAIWGQLAGAYPDRYWRDLAGSLSNLGVRLSELGRPADALSAEQEAVAIRRELAAAYPDRYRPDLASSLTNLGITFSELGRPADALPPAEEAVAIYRQVAAAYPDRYRTDLALSLSNLGNQLSEVGRPADALSAEQEAVAIRRELAAAYPDRYRPDLATSLTNLGITFSELGRPADALPPAEEAVATYRELFGAYPDRYRADLALSLSNLGNGLAALGRPADALPPVEEAVAIYRELAVAYPDRHRRHLVGSLSNLGNRLSEVGRPADALSAEQEAVAIRRELAAAYPDRYRPDLATSLTNLGKHLSEVGRPADALSAEQEAVAILRELAAAYPDRYRPDLATSLTNLGITFSELGRPADALPPAEEAVAIYRELAATDPNRHRPDLATSLSNLGKHLSEVGRPADALSVEQEAVAIRRELGCRYP
jgi:tetratricopeptide (TPR) repeat protein